MSAAEAKPSEEHHTSYVKIWGLLLVLLAVSVAGPMLGIRIVTLITAFGIAIVKAYIVAKYFMHVTLERRWVAYLLVAMLALMALFVGGTSPDVLKHKGRHWENTAARSAVEKGLEEGASGAHHQ
jgi:caa(3)-type oxidase subunit IV